jgi:hypothetical protein
MGRSKRALAALCGGGVLVVASALPASADVIDPEGACGALGTWVAEGETRASGDFVPDDVIVIPQEDSVAWEGGVGDAAPGDTGPSREISGEVEVDVGSIAALKIDDWGGDSELYGNSGTYEYEVPDTLVNVKMKLKGEHREEGQRVCGGSVYLQVEGDTFANPLSILFLVLMVLAAGGLMAAGIVRKATP